MKNNIAGCHNEAVAYAEFLTGLVDDFDTGMMSRDDLMALFDKYAGSNPPIGKFFYTSGCVSVYFYPYMQKLLNQGKQHTVQNL